MNFKYIFKWICVLFLISKYQPSCYASQQVVLTNSAASRNLWQPRSYSSYSLEEIQLYKNINCKNLETWNRSVGVTFDAMQNFNNCNICGQNKLSSMPFWSGTNTMTIGDNSGLYDLDAYQFGLGNAVTSGSISILPDIQYIGSTALFYATQSEDKQHLYVKVQASLGALRIHSRLQENPAKLDNSVDTQWAEYSAPDNRNKTLSAAFQGGSIGGDSAQSNLHKSISLDYGRIASNTLTAIRLADVSAVIGANVYAKNKDFFAFGFKVSCPTGNVANGKFVFEPIVGRNGLWGVGAEFSGHKCWELSKPERHIDLWTQAEVLHLCTGRKPSWRTFDLVQNGPGSKYLLTQFYYPGNPSSSNPYGRIPSFITQVANISTLPVSSSFAVEGSAALMVDCTFDGWNVALGAEIWGRTKERLSIDIPNVLNYNCVYLNDYAVLGRQISEDSDFITPYSLYLCQPLAQINKSLSRVVATGTPGSLNGSTPAAYDTTQIKDARIVTNRIPGNFCEALDIDAAKAPRAITGKFLAQIGYTFDHHMYCPYVGLSGAVEISDSCSNMPYLWSVGCTGSLQF